MLYMIHAWKGSSYTKKSRMKASIIYEIGVNSRKPKILQFFDIAILLISYQIKYGVCRKLGYLDIFFEFSFILVCRLLVLYLKVSNCNPVGVEFKVFVTYGTSRTPLYLTVYEPAMFLD